MHIIKRLVYSVYIIMHLLVNGMILSFYGHALALLRTCAYIYIALSVTYKFYISQMMAVFTQAWSAGTTHCHCCQGWTCTVHGHCCQGWTGTVHGHCCQGWTGVKSVCFGALGRAHFLRIMAEGIWPMMSQSTVDFTNCSNFTL